MTTRSMSRPVLALAAVLTLTAGNATVAHADSFRHRDATGDVIVAKIGSHGVESRYVDPSRLKPDIQQFTVLHTPDVVSVATTLRGLNSIDDRWVATVVTSKGDRFQVGRTVSSGEIGPFVTVSRNGYRFTCDGITATRTSSGVIAKVPTRCLGNPWKVRVGVQADVDYAECCP